MEQTHRHSRSLKRFLGGQERILGQIGGGRGGTGIGAGTGTGTTTGPPPWGGTFFGPGKICAFVA